MKTNTTQDDKTFLEEDDRQLSKNIVARLRKYTTICDEDMECIILDEILRYKAKVEGK